MRTASAHQAERTRLNWIVEWLKENIAADAVTESFHDEYHQMFPSFKVRETNWGAQPVAQAMRDLKKLYDQGTIERARIGLGSGWQQGFPKSVFSYSLNRTITPSEGVDK